jgi:hypothetical protein
LAWLWFRRLWLNAFVVFMVQPYPQWPAGEVKRNEFW